MTSWSEQRVSRRRWLRRAVGTTVAATAAGALIAAKPAQADPGDAVVLGEANDAGGLPTTITGDAAAEPVLTLANDADGAALQLSIPDQLVVDWEPPLGALTLDPDGDLLTMSADAEGTFPAWAYSTAWATMTIAIRPQRILDTRTAAGRANIVGGAGNIDAAGRLLGGRTIRVAVGHADRPYQVLANITVTKTAGQGYLTVWGDGARPGTSSVNFFGANQVLSNYVESPAGREGDTDVITIFASVTTSVVVDVCGFLVADPAQVDEAVL